MIERKQRRRFRHILARKNIELEAVACDVGQLVARQTGIDDVRHDHRVGESLRHRPAVHSQPAHLQLCVVRDEETIGLQQAPELR